jgi:hypothetical protein
MVYAESDYRVSGFTTSNLGLVLTPVHEHRPAVYNMTSKTLRLTPKSTMNKILATMQTHRTVIFYKTRE